MSDSERQNVAVKEKNSDSHDGSDNVNVDVTCTDREKAEQLAGKSQYEKTKEKNIAEIQDILADLNASYPIPAELEEKHRRCKQSRRNERKRNQWYNVNHKDTRIRSGE